MSSPEDHDTVQALVLMCCTLCFNQQEYTMTKLKIDTKSQAIISRANGTSSYYLVQMEGLVSIVWRTLVS